MFNRKVYDELLNWKNNYCPEYACLLEGARRVGKTTVAEEFAKNEFDTYILIDFSKASKSTLEIFDDMSDLDIFFLRLQAQSKVTLKEGKSVIIFDEIQLFPKARQAIKHLVKDGRFAYIETGSLISIKKNVKNILIPSEEHKIQVYPMDYEEFLWATGGNADNLRLLTDKGIEAGNSLNRTLMRDFRIYMAVGGMPQAVEAYVNKKNFDAIDKIKREIIALYKDDLKKIDESGRLSKMYEAVPAQLALDKKKYTITGALKKQKTTKDEERLFNLIDSRIVLPCYHVTEPIQPLVQTEDVSTYKLYLSDIGLFTTMLFNDSEKPISDIYQMLLSDKLNANLGYLYENAAAQIIAAKGYKLYYHTWRKENSTHYHEIDFLVSEGKKISAIEIKSSSARNHESLDIIAEKYTKQIGKRYLFSQKDVSEKDNIYFKPIYMLQFMFNK